MRNSLGFPLPFRCAVWWCISSLAPNPKNPLDHQLPSGYATAAMYSRRHVVTVPVSSVSRFSLSLVKSVLHHSQQCMNTRACVCECASQCVSASVNGCVRH
jgi:hypothetical protein